MPGYRVLPDQFSGALADLTREAALLEEQGRPDDAIALYERALATAVVDATAMPSYLCGRLAMLYRQARRYEDEVDLLERYQRTQESERERTRFDARLSKARAMVQKLSRSHDSGALSSIRAFGPSNYARRASTGKKRSEPDDRP